MAEDVCSDASGRRFAVDAFLSHAERAVALLERCRPSNYRPELERLTEAWRRGAPATPEWRYRPRPDFSSLLSALESFAAEPGAGTVVDALYAERARELYAEATIPLAIGTPEFAARAAARFSEDRSDLGELAERTARRWAAIELADAEPGVRADDERDPRSLVSVLRSVIGALRLPVRIVYDEQLASAAATGEGVVLVRPDLRHREASARRIALHEVEGHVLPRVRGRSEALGLFGVGAAGGADDEEGRALFIEERHDLLDEGRRRELGLRHVAALAVRRGADWVETMRHVLSFGVAPEDAVRLVARVHRGGGLAREIVYLPAFLRVRAALLEDPSLESWLERGRLGIVAARVLRDAERAGDVTASRVTPAYLNVAITGV